MGRQFIHLRMTSELTPEMAAARAKLAARFTGVQTGGAGTARRKRVAHHQSNAVDDKKLQAQLKRLGMSPIPGIDEVNMFKTDGTVLHFSAPKMQAAIQANTFAITGTCQEKPLAEVIKKEGSNFLQQLGPEAIKELKDMAASYAANPSPQDDEDVPDLVGDFEEVSKQ